LDRSQSIGALLLLVLLAAGPTPEQLNDAERDKAADIAAQRAAQAQAQAAAEQERALAQARVDAAARLRVAEDALAAASANIADLTERRAEAQQRLAARAAELAPVLPVIERLSLYPTETLLAVPMDPEQAVRGVLVLGGIARTLESQAAALRAEQATVASLRGQIDAALPGLAQAQAEQAQLAQTLDEQLAHVHAERTAAEDAAADAARSAAADAARADTLRAAIARIEAERRAAELRARDEAAAADRHRQEAEAAKARARQEALARPAGPGVGEARALLTAPVAGSVARAYGTATEAGPASGVSYLAPPSARVVSPCGGRVVFAGPFRSFGLLMIVDCGGGYHFVLSGLDRLDAQVGQPVQPGEPVGVMPAWDPRASAANNPPAHPAGGAAPGRPLLYMELRKDGVPVDPEPFLRART
jgi:septal ring factor EnvC (AmiA/AmiB activator)